MAGIARSIIEKNLKKKGFIERGGSHRNYIFHYQGKATSIRTWVSHGSKGHQDCGDGILKAMRHQLKLDSLFLVRQLLECPMDEKQYIKLLKEKGILRNSA